MGIYQQEPSSVTLLSTARPIEQQSFPTIVQKSLITTVMQRRNILDAALRQLAASAGILTDVACLLVDTLRSGHKVLVAGNGGSAAESQHFAAELVGRFKRERVPYAVLSLTTDTSIMTAVANDYGYQQVFARQVCAFGQPGDLFLAFSTSGESENLLCAAEAGKQRLMTVVSVTGERASRLEAVSDMTIRVPVQDTAIAQELHMIVTHLLCDIVETHLSTSDADDTEYATQAVVASHLNEVQR